MLVIQFAGRLCCLLWESSPERLPLSQYIGQSTVKRIWKLDRDTEIYPRSCTGNWYTLGVAPSQPLLVEWFPDYEISGQPVVPWHHLTLLMPLVLLYLNKTKRPVISIVLSLIL